MKNKIKSLIICTILSLILVGCGAKSSDDIIVSLDNKLKKADSYFVTGVMEIINNEDTYTYDVSISYKKDNYYKINLVNTLNNHEQVILRNDDGVYVVTPSLNKSFKFQSDWPYNNSQVYLLGSIINDLKNDNNRSFSSIKNGYILKSLVNYPNNKSLAKQNVYVNNNNNVYKVEVTDKNNKVQISMKFDKIKFNKKFDEEYFELSNLISFNNKGNSKNNNDINNNSNADNTNDTSSNNNDTNNNTNDTSSNNNDTNNNTNDDNISNNKEKNTRETATIDDVIYPMYLPNNTALANKEVVKTDKGQRLILTFDGDKPFTLVEEVASYYEGGVIVPVSGNLDFLTDVIGVINDNSLTWESNGIEYYLVSDTIETSELIEIAQSINVLPVSK